MLAVVHVAAEEVDVVVLKKPLGCFLCTTAEVAGEGEEVDLEAYAGVVKLGVALAVAAVVVVTLRVCKDWVEVL